jgi:nucleotide-binding universal stress UspA family protein
MRRGLYLALALLAGCGGDATRRTTPPAAEGVKAYVTVLRAGDPAQAYALLSDEVKAQISYDDFALQWNESAPEREHQARALEEGLKGSADLGERAKIVYPDGKTVYLVRENGAWRLESAVMSRVHAGQPRDAVAIFAEALNRRDYQAALRVLTTRRREGIGEQVDSFVKSLLERLQSGDGTIETIGKDRAEMRWDDGKRRYKIILRKEGDQWRVDDIHLRPAPAAPEEGADAPSGPETEQ